MAVEKLLPQNIEAEAGVLGSLLIDPGAIVQVADFLAPMISIARRIARFTAPRWTSTRRAIPPT